MKKLLVLLFLLSSVTVYAEEKCPCPEIRLAKFECSDTNGVWVCTEGDCDNFVVIGNCQLATITGVYDTLWVKAGQSCEEQSNPIHAIDGQDMSHVNICSDHPAAVTLSSFRALRWWERLWRLFW